MAIDLLAEKRLSITELAGQLGVAIPTVWRWRQKGVRGVRLETFMLGGRRFTTQEAHRRFVERTTAAANGEQPSAKARTNRQREASIKRAEAQLDAMGVV